MALLGWCALLLTLSAHIATAEYDQEVCSFYKESYGLIPPPLPRNFEVKGERVDFFDKSTIYQEMYFDFSNFRGKYMSLENGIEHHLLVDYDARQVVEYDIIHPGKNVKDDPLSHACMATDMDDSEYKDVFGFLDEYSNWPKMYDSNQVMHFGGQYQYAFNGTYRMPERGMLADKFVGCVYDDSTGATMAMNYSFTNAAVYASGGTTLEAVLGTFDGMLSVPAGLDMVGSVYDEDTQQRRALNRSESMFWFKGEPEFALDTFRIPPYMYCENFRGAALMPEIPHAFSTRLQRTNIQRDTLGNLAASEVTSFEEVFYYRDKSLARRDYTPDPYLDTDIYSKFLNYDPVRTVYDFNTGVLYVTNRPTGRCYYRPIIPGDFFDASNHSMYIKMADPAEVFRMQTDEMQHKGTDFVRDVECDVFAGTYHDATYNATYIKETYVTSNGWHVEADELLEYATPIKHTIITRDFTADLVESVSTYHFLKFKSTAPPLMHFDISNCLETINHKDYAILLTISAAERLTIFKYKMQFLESAQYYLAEITEVFTPLRVQRLQLRQVSQSDTRTLLVFTLVDKPKLKTQTPVGQPGSSLDDAVLKLQKFIDRNQFAVRFVPPEEKDPITIKALRGSFYIRTADGDLQAPQAIWSDNTGTTEDEAIPPAIFHADDGSEGKKKGMSPGGLAVLALVMLFIGIGIGISVMYLYLRRQNENKLDMRITLTPQTSSTEMAEAVPTTAI